MKSQTADQDHTAYHAHRHYRHRRDHGDRHPAALRHLFNRMLGQLYYRLQTGQHYQPHKAFTTHPTSPEPYPLT